MDEALFAVGPVGPRKAEAGAAGEPRVERPVRNQVEMVYSDLDSLLPDDHQARAIWEYVAQADLSELYGQIRAVEGGAGRPATDPRILVALWVYATVDGIGSARGLAELCEESVVYRWICGGVSVNYHTLSDFRVEAGAVLDRLVTESVARLRLAGLVRLQRVAHDGLRVRASAGSGSFRRLKKLEQLREEARQQVAALRQELEENPGASTARRRAARERAAREREERVTEALRQYEGVKRKKKKNKEEARVSVTDPDARTMHMPDGGFRPGYNVQFSTDVGSQVIVGADVTNSGSDTDQLQPAVEQLRERHHATPQEMLVDGGFVNRKAIEELARPPNGCTVYAPVPAPTVPGRPADQPFVEETPAVREWHQRMATPEAQAIYKQRAATAECVNAIARNRGLRAFAVRGLQKVRTVVLWFALAHNVMRTISLMGGSG